MNNDREISRTTYDNIRVSIDGGIVYRGLYAVNRKPLQPHEVALAAGVIALCDADELPLVVKFARTLSTPGEILSAIEAKRNPRAKPAKPHRRSCRCTRCLMEHCKNGCRIVGCAVCFK